MNLYEMYRRREIRRVADIVFSRGNPKEIEQYINMFGDYCYTPTPVMGGKLVQPFYEINGITVYRDVAKTVEYIGIAYGNVARVLNYAKIPRYKNGKYLGWEL